MIVLDFTPMHMGSEWMVWTGLCSFYGLPPKSWPRALSLFFLLISAGFIGYDCANVYVIVHDGMTQRMSVITETTSDPSVMNKYFTPEAIAEDPMLGNVVPDGVLIQDYSYALRIKKLWVWPWKSRTRITVLDEVARVNKGPVEEDGYVPDSLDLGTGESKISLIKENGRWYIDRIERLRTQTEIEAEEELRNPATPTPEPEDSPEAAESQ